MNLSWIDWAIMAVAVVSLRFVSLSTRHYMKGVADFLSANRAAGRYLLTIASQMGGIGVITFIGIFEMTYSAGLSPGWWGLMSLPVSVIILLTGWIYYRFRETRALTMAQFFEMRYSRRFKIFAGAICWTSGILNFGIFPAVAARFFMYFCGLPDHFNIPGIPWDISTFAAIMLVDLALALSFVMMGGQISVMITECVQGMFCSAAFLVVSIAVLMQVKWPQMVEALKLAPANASMINPFHTSAVKDFNVWYFLIGLLGAFYSYMSWQGTSGFYSSARSPHEQKMGGIIGVWRAVPQNLMAMLLPLAALAILKLPEFSDKAALINQSLAQISDETIKGQMRVPIVMANILPAGIKGLLATIMLFVSFTCHDTYMHSWGSIFIQDVVMPIRKRALSPEQHIRWLRWSILGVAIFAFLFSLFYPLDQKIFMYFAITGTIWTGGSGAAIIGGLYWRRGTTAAGYAGLITGAVVGVAGLIIPNIYKNCYGREFPINGAWISLIGIVSAVLAYVSVSLLTGSKEKQFNLERMLHRGRYSDTQSPIAGGPSQSRWLQIVGITREFSLADKVLAIVLVTWNGLNFGFFIVFSTINLLFHVADSAWVKWWHFILTWNLCLSVPIIIWFTIGGVLDIKGLLKHLATAVRDVNDDGRVPHSEEPSVASSEDAPAVEPDQRVSAGV